MKHGIEGSTTISDVKWVIAKNRVLRMTFVQIIAIDVSA